MLRRRLDTRHAEDGVAMIAAIALLVICGLIAIAIMMGARATADSARSSQTTANTELLARDAATALAGAFNAMRAGEHNGYVLTKAMLADHAAQMGGGTKPVANGTLKPKELQDVDPRVPSSGQFALERPLGNGITGYWQVYSVKLPTYGVTRGGRVLVYVRAWTRSAAGTQRPALYRIEFRPTWFADYQMVFDGRAEFGSDAVINGRVHSNGYDASYYNQYAGLGTQIQLNGATCTGAATISTASGTISGGTGCGRRFENTNRQFNFLRARTMAEQLRALCKGPNPPSIAITCPTTPVTKVKLNPNTISVNGKTLKARVAGDHPGDHQGAVVVAPGDVELSGTLGKESRALVVAAAPPGSADYGAYGAPSIWIRGNVGSADNPRSSFGAVAEGDVIFDEYSIGSATARGAFLTMSGMVSHHPQWRSRVVVGSGKMSGSVTIRGSIAGHFPPLMESPHNNAGFSKRTYAWDAGLFDNPPPMYPTAADWEVLGLEIANLDCFDAKGRLKSDVEECG